MAKREFKIKKILILWICIIIITLTAGVVYALDSWNTGFRVNNGGTGTIIDLASHSDAACRECKKVIDASGKDIFIGTKTCAEWNSFKSNLPSGVTIAACAAPFVCGVDTVKDSENTAYATVQIGTQCWMKENIRVGAMISGGVNQNNPPNPIQKYCWGNNPANCATYGGYYQWHEAMQLDQSCDIDNSCLAQVKYPHQGICPIGWHIPSDVGASGETNDWSVLETFLWTQGGSVGTCLANRVDSSACSDAATRMKAASGLNLKLVGSWTDGAWVDMNADGHYWSSAATIYSGGDTDPVTRAWARNIESPITTAVERKGKEKGVRALNVRCIKD